MVIDVHSYEHSDSRQRHHLRRIDRDHAGSSCEQASEGNPRRMVFRVDLDSARSSLVSLQEAHTMTAVIRVDGVSRWFGSVVAVSDVSFDIEPGITGLLGPNGAGK